MPNYGWLLTDEIDTASTGARIRAMQTLGVPYPAGYDKIANTDLQAQAKGIKERLQKDKIKTGNNTEILAVIAYLQRLGTDIKAAPATASQH